MNLEDIVFISEKKNINTKSFIVDWELGIFCNYSCSYCFPNSNSKIYDFKNISRYIKNVDSIVKHATQENFENLIFWFSGGEITTYKNIDVLFKYINDIQLIDVELNVITNLSPSINYWKKFIDNTKNLKVGMIASYHIEYCNPKEFIEKCLFLNSNIDLLVKIVVSPKHFLAIKEIEKLFDDTSLKVHFIHERIEGEISQEYTQEALDFIDIRNSKLENKLLIKSNSEEDYISSGEFFIKNKFQDFRGWNCIAGKNSIAIDRNGNIRRCISSETENMGNIMNGHIKPITGKCITKKCKCIGDLHLTKWKE